MYPFLYDPVHGFPYARLLSIRKPSSYTKNYMQYAMAVTACEASCMHSGVAGDVIFVDMNTRQYGVPFAQLMRSDVASPNFTLDSYDGPSASSSSSSSSSSSHPVSEFAAEPMMEALTDDHIHSLRNFMHMIPRPAPIDGGNADTYPTMPPTSTHSTLVLSAWMTRTHWMQSPLTSTHTYGELFEEWASQQKKEWTIVISPTWTWIANGCEAREIRFYRA
jgi:hypothetical protein